MRTYTGRVVYDRKLHVFNESDLMRVGKSIFFRAPAEKGKIYEILYRVSTYFLRQILDIFGVGIFTGVVYLYLTDFVGRLFGYARATVTSWDPNPSVTYLAGWLYANYPAATKIGLANSGLVMA